MILKTVNELFSVKYGVNLELVNLVECSRDDDDAIPFVSRTEKNNGISAYVKREIGVPSNPAMTISVAGGGSVLSTFLQKSEYYSGRDMYILTPRQNYSELELLFYVHCIRQNKYRYNYGRQANKTLRQILIPHKVPEDWKRHKPNDYNTLTRNPLFSTHSQLNVHNWKYFLLNDLFDISGTKTTPLQELEAVGVGPFPYVTTQSTNNGVEGVFSTNTEKGGVFTVDSAVLGYCSYQPYDFSASDHVEKLTPKFNFNKYIALFLTTVINLEQYRYNYGRKASQSRLKHSEVKLPTDASGAPDWQFMEDYIKSLPYSSNI